MPKCQNCGHAIGITSGTWCHALPGDQFAIKCPVIGCHCYNAVPVPEAKKE